MAALATKAPVEVVEAVHRWIEERLDADPAPFVLDLRRIDE